MGKNLKKYIISSIIWAFVGHIIVISFFFIVCLFSIINDGLINEYTIIFFSIALITLFRLTYLLIKKIYCMKKIKLEDYKIIEKELKNPILIAYKDYILTDTYIINLRKIHIFKYSDITHMYKKCGIRIVGNQIRIVKYLCTKTNDGLKDKFLIGFPFILNCTLFQDFSDIIIKKNPYVLSKKI